MEEEEEEGKSLSLILLIFAGTVLLSLVLCDAEERKHTSTVTLVISIDSPVADVYT